MDKYEKNIEILRFLKQNCGACAIKLEFETEYTTDNDNNLFKELVKQSDMELSIKIGGAGAFRDLILAKNMGANNIIAPMVESVYSLKKFVDSVKLLQDNNIKLYFNLETIGGFSNLDLMIENTSLIKSLAGVVFGRTDFAHSLGFQDCKEANSSEVLDYLNLSLKKLENTALEVLVGGNISFHSIDFLRKVNSDIFSKIETRKVVFNKEKFLSNPNLAIKKALEFEQNWLEMKEISSFFDKKRIDLLKKRLSEDVCS